MITCPPKPPKAARPKGKPPELKCPDCGTKLLQLQPPLSQRTGQNGLPMTRAEAIHLFVDSRGGRCTDCYLAD